jgi:hypothetical protein
MVAYLKRQISESSRWQAINNHLKISHAPWWVCEQKDTQLIDRGPIKYHKLWPCLTTSNCCGSHKVYLKQKLTENCGESMRRLKNIARGWWPLIIIWLSSKCKICPSTAEQCDKQTRALAHLRLCSTPSLYLGLYCVRLSWWCGRE